MSQGKPANEMDAGRPFGDRQIREGDIVVTAVAGHYAIGRMTGDAKTQESLGSQQTRAEALQQACALAGAKHRVFLYPSPGSSGYLPIDCAEASKQPSVIE